MNFLQRMPQSAKVALVAALLVGAVATWYLAFFRPAQLAEQPVTPTPAPAQPGAAPVAPPVTARPLEVLPLPFLVTEAPRPVDQGVLGQADAIALARPRITVPPNPFVPLVVETVSPAVAQPPTPPVAPQPIPRQAAQVQVRQPIAALPRPGLPGDRPAPGVAALSAPIGQARLAQGTARPGLPRVAELGVGALPIRLAPLDRELAADPARTAAALDLENLETAAATAAGADLDFARAEIGARLAQVLEPRTSLVPGQQAEQESALARWVREQNLKLSGVVLGPTSVAIFQSRDGFTVLPVGRTLPGSDVLLRSLSANEALLVQGSESLNLTITTP